MKKLSSDPQAPKSSISKAKTRASDRSPSKQRNTPLSVQEVSERLLPLGWNLISNHPNGTVTCATLVQVQCAAGHTSTKQYGNIRDRGCPECSAPWGERMLYALLRHYVDGLNDWKRKAVRGLDPKDPRRRLVFDCYSDSRRVVIENHSSYHQRGSAIVFGNGQISNEERTRLDILKIPENGLHEAGPLKGWRAGVVWFEMSRLIEIKRVSRDYLPQVIKEFKELSNELGLPLKDVPDITNFDVYRMVAKDVLKDVKPGFELVGEWCGRAREHRWKHVCGGQFLALVTTVETSVTHQTGCPFCDRTGQPGAWLDFLDCLEDHGYQLNNPHRMEVKTEHQLVPLRCIAHPEAEVRIFTRSKLYQWLSSLSETSSVSMLPPCIECAKSHLLHIAQKQTIRNQKERDHLDARLKSYGHSMITRLPSSVRDPLTHKVNAQKNIIRCNNCGHERSVFVLQTLQKAEKSGSMGCPVCRPVKKGPKKATHSRRVRRY